MARIDLWFDYISPYAYFAVFRMKEIAEAYGEQVRLRPVLFAALLDHHGQLGPAEIPAKREHTFKDAARYAALHQLPLQGPAAHPFNPVTALRCSLPEVAGADQAGVVEALFLGSWGHGGDLGDPESVARILTEAGYEGAAMVARTRDPAVKARLREESEAAIARGVFGVPTVDCDGELFWGSDRLDWVALRIEGRDPLPEGAAERLLKVPSGATRPGSKRDAPNPGRSGSGDPKAS